MGINKHHEHHHGKKHEKKNEEQTEEAQPCPCHKETSALSEHLGVSKCTVDYYTETFSYMFFGMGMSAATMLLMDEQNRNLVLGVADEVADMTLSTLDEVAMDKSVIGFLESVAVAFEKTVSQMAMLVYHIFIHELIGTNQIVNQLLAM